MPCKVPSPLIPFESCCLWISKDSPVGGQVPVYAPSSLRGLLFTGQTACLVLYWALGTQGRSLGPFPELLSIQKLDSHLNKATEASRN